MPPLILAHRANLNGPRSVVENSLEACAAALGEGFGLETDLRRDAEGKFYISHDPAPRTEANALEGFTKLFQGFPSAEIAMNVKELGYEAELISLMNSGRLGPRCFYFDFELLEPETPGAAQRKIRALPGGGKFRQAARLSDRGETLDRCLSIPAEVVWADEFDSLWLTEDEVRRVHEAGRQFHVISPEIHEFGREAMFRRWDNFAAWQVDGVCTDYPLEARKFFAH